MKLTQANVDRLTLPAGKTDHIEFDDDLPGFGVRLRAGGKRTWIIQYRVGKKQRRFTLAAVGKLSAKKAREEADERLARVTLGGDPQAKKIEDRAKAHVTFGALLEDYLTERAKEVEKGELRKRTFEEIARYLRQHCKPMHELQITKVTRMDVASRLAKIRAANGETAAIRARSAMSGFLAWTVAEGHIDTNPVAGTNKPKEPKARDRVLSDAELTDIWSACRDDDYGRIVKLLMLTAARRDEIGGLLETELNIEAEINLPPERTKNGREHMIPLSALAMSVVTSVPRRVGRNTLFGEGANGFSGWSKAKEALDARISDNRRKAKVAAMPDWHLHDLRRTVDTQLHELGVQPHIVEAILNHVSGHKAGVAGVYNRALYAAEKRAALNLWGDRIRSIVEGTERKVIPLRA